MVRPQAVLECRFAKLGHKKFAKFFAFELGSKSGVMRAFQKGITIGGSLLGG